MRTTLTLEDDVFDALKERARQLDQPFKQVVNDILRRGLRPERATPSEPFRVRPLNCGLQPGVDPLRLNQLSDELEAEAFLEKQACVEGRGPEASPGR
ncbi:MAG: antitoxin [bacterium]|nr:antitoxin [bacterium]MCY4193088.1 antitoxin [bacterium]MCY4271140.1 antitoxin [bacterium]